MRTYDPADSIVYVHLAQSPVSSPAATAECHRLPAGYANGDLRARLLEPRTPETRPALVLLPGGSSAAEAPAPAVPALRLAR